MNLAITTTQMVILAILTALVAATALFLLWRWWKINSTPIFAPMVECKTVCVRTGGGGGGGGRGTANLNVASGGGAGGRDVIDVRTPSSDIIAASHDIAAFAVSQRDNVNMYSAVREKALEVLIPVHEACGNQTTVVNCETTINLEKLTNGCKDARRAQRINCEVGGNRRGYRRGYGS